MERGNPDYKPVKQWTWRPFQSNLPPLQSGRMNKLQYIDPAEQTYREARQSHWDAIARKRDSWRGMGYWYHRRIADMYRFLISPGQRVLEIGSGAGDLLARVQPSRGLGIDFSAEQVARACERNPQIECFQADAHDLSDIQDKFDVIILSDLINELWDVQRVLEQVKPLCTPRTRIIINFYSRLWELPLHITQLLNLATPTLAQNWLTPPDVINMLNLAGFETVRSWQEVLWPLPLGGFFNKFLVRFWPFNEFALANFLVARPQPELTNGQPTVSVIVPARNEAGNIKAIFERLPKMGREIELVFVEGHSKDDTYATIEMEIAAHPATRGLLLRQSGVGKADAVRLGFERASGEILMILDADLTVPPEDLPRFYEALVSGKGEFINGVRLVYPMEEQAMRSLNFLGNKFFSLAFSWLLGQPIKDTLCGTKVLWKKDYETIAANRSYFGDFDPFGDFDLIFGAAKQNLKIVDLPIRYRERTYGSTNISRWKHGLLLMRMVAFAARRIKFV
jgi:SAM-dependent methyltransferase